MPTPSSGSLRLQADIAAVSLGSGYTGALTTNVGMSNFVRGGTYIPNIAAGNNQATTPTSQLNMSFGLYFNVWGYKRLSFTLTAGVGNYVSGKTNSNYWGFSVASGSGSTLNPYNNGYSSRFGSISANQFTTPNGTMTINGFYRDNGGSATTGCLVLWSNVAPANNDFSWISGFNGAGSVSFARSSSTNYLTSGTTAYYAPSAATTFGNWTAMTNGGTYSCYINYYG
jgi:hypothetical protein